MKHTKDKGDLAEMAVARRLMEMGYTVSFPFGDNARYDLIYDDGSLHRVQVKWGRSEDGAVAADVSSHNKRVGEIIHNPYSEESVDELAIYHHETGQCYIVPIAHVPTREMRLRIDPPKNGQVDGVNFAEDYVL